MAHSEDEYDTKHAAMLGGVSLAWNDIHSEVLETFAALSEMPWDRADAIFFALKADQAQRDITIALIKTVLCNSEDVVLRDRGTSLMGQIGSYAGERNIATHAMWVTRHPSKTIAPHPFSSRSKDVRSDYEAQFATLTRRLRKLYIELLDYRSDLSEHLKRRAATP